MRRTFIPFLILMALWLVLSGHYTPFLIGLGALSCAFSLWLVRRLGSEPDWVWLGRALPALLRYMPWLIREVIRSNLDLCRRIWHPALPIQPQILRVPAQQRTALGVSLFANSITLTPGTLSIELRRGEIEVHALSDVSAADLAGGEMHRRVLAVDAAATRDTEA